MVWKMERVCVASVSPPFMPSLLGVMPAPAFPRMPFPGISWSRAFVGGSDVDRSGPFDIAGTPRGDHAT